MTDWFALLDGPPGALQAVLTGTDERSVTLRSSSPFAGVISYGSVGNYGKAGRTANAQFAQAKRSPREPGRVLIIGPRGFRKFY